MSCKTNCARYARTREAKNLFEELPGAPQAEGEILPATGAPPVVPVSGSEGFDPTRYAGKSSEEVARTVVYLASEAASFVIGENIEINGGMLMD